MMATKDYSTKQEESVANFLVWDVVAGSGARDFNKGDVVTEDWLGECKTHEEKGCDIVFNRAVWEKISKEAESFRRNPILIVDDGSQDIDKTWCLFRKVCLADDDAQIQPLSGTYQTNIRFDHNMMKKEFEKDKQYFNFDKVVYQTDLFDEELVVCPLSEFSDIISYY